MVANLHHVRILYWCLCAAILGHSHCSSSLPSYSLLLLLLLPLCCRLWFLRPLKDLAVLTERQEAVAFFSQQCNQEVMGSLADCLRNIKNLPVRRGGEGKGREGRGGEGGEGGYGSDNWGPGSKMWGTCCNNYTAGSG